MKDNKKMDNKKLVRIIVPVCIILVVAGIWVFKNVDKGTADLSPTSSINNDFELETDSIDLEALTSYGLPIIIDFGADSCEPCKAMAPVLVKLNTEMQGKVIIKFVDVWKNPSAANDFPVQLIPTQFFFNADGTPYVPRDNVEIKFEMYSYNDTGDHAFTVHQGGLTEGEMRAILANMGVNE